MKEVAVDCTIHRKSNILEGDKKYSKICSYSDKCKYKCYADPEKSESPKSKSGSDKDKAGVDRDTYRILHSKNKIDQCVSIIKDFYRNNAVAEFDTLLDICSNSVSISKKELKEIVAYSLNQLVEGETQIKNETGFSGKIVHKDKYYIFEEIECDDDPLHYRKSRILVREDKNRLDIKDLK